MMLENELQVDHQEAPGPACCGNCNGSMLMMNYYEGCWYCLICGWDSNGPDRDERERILEETADFTTVRSHRDRNRGTNRPLRDGGGSSAYYERMREKDMARYRQVEIDVWHVGTTQVGFMTTEPRKVLMKIKYEIDANSRARRSGNAHIVDILVDLKGVTWPAFGGTFWATVSRSFKKKTGYTLFGLQRYVNQYVTKRSPVREVRRGHRNNGHSARHRG